MGILDGIMSNKSLQNLAFSNLKKFFASGEAKAIVVSMDDNGEVVVDIAKHGICVIEPLQNGKGWDLDNKKFYGVTVKKKEVNDAKD